MKRRKGIYDIRASLHIQNGGSGHLEIRSLLAFCGVRGFCMVRWTFVMNILIVHVSYSVMASL
jgi:hypothetical protein